MTEAIVVPEVGGDTTSEIVLERWLVAAGAPVRAGALVAYLETDKATIEVSATVDGVLRACLVAEGAKVRVGEVIGEIAAGEVAAHAIVPAPLRVAPHAPAEPAWEVRTFELPFGADRLTLEPGWEPFGVLDGRRIVARRRR